MNRQKNELLINLIFIPRTITPLSTKAIENTVIY